MRNGWSTRVERKEASATRKRTTKTFPVSEPLKELSPEMQAYVRRMVVEEGYNLANLVITSPTEVYFKN
jgi:hypothetical protein